MEREYIKLEIVAPFFPGFYNTVYDWDDGLFDADMDENVFPKLEEAGLMHPTGIFTETDVYNAYFSSRIIDEVNREYERDIGYNIVAFIEGLLQGCTEYGFEDSTIIFRDVWSPGEYNFRNDHINMDVLIDKEGFIKAITGPVRPILKALVKRECTSRSGFISFYSNDAESDEWLGNIEEMLGNNTKAGICFEALVIHLMIGGDTEYTDDTDLDALRDEFSMNIYEDVQGNTGWAYRTDEFLLEFLLEKMPEIMGSRPDAVAEDLNNSPDTYRLRKVLSPIFEKCAASESMRHIVRGSLSGLAADGLKKLWE